MASITSKKSIVDRSCKKTSWVGGT